MKQLIIIIAAVILGIIVVNVAESGYSLTDDLKDLYHYVDKYKWHLLPILLVAVIALIVSSD